MLPADHSAQRALEAYNALAEADAFATARVAWEDFLTHWRRGLNRCDVEGSRLQGRSYVRSYERVKADPALTYLWAARNAEEHGVDKIADVQERAFALAAFGGYSSEVDYDSNRRPTFRFTPLTDDPPPFFAILPEHIKLCAITERGHQLPVPIGYDYAFGEQPAAVALAKVGLDFLLDQVASLTG